MSRSSKDFFLYLYYAIVGTGQRHDIDGTKHTLYRHSIKSRLSNPLQQTHTVWSQLNVVDMCRGIINPITLSSSKQRAAVSFPFPFIVFIWIPYLLNGVCLCVVMHVIYHCNESNDSSPKTKCACIFGTRFGFLGFCKSLAGRVVEYC